MHQFRKGFKNILFHNENFVAKKVYLKGILEVGP